MLWMLILNNKNAGIMITHSPFNIYQVYPLNHSNLLKKSHGANIVGDGEDY